MPDARDGRYGYVMAVRMPTDAREFAMVRTDVEAVIQRCGVRTWDCILIDVDGNWTRAVFTSKEAAEAACADLDIRTHESWDDPRMARRMNRRDHWGEPGGQRRAL